MITLPVTALPEPSSIEELLLDLKEEPSRRFLRNWLAIRQGNRVPLRRDVDPTAIALLLSHVWLWDFDNARGDFICRLAGEAAIRIYKRNPRGLALGEWVPQTVADVARARYRRVIDEPAICVATGTTYIAGDKRAWCERVITPLSDGAGPPNIVFGITYWRQPRFSTGPVEREDTTARFVRLVS